MSTATRTATNPLIRAGASARRATQTTPRAISALDGGSSAARPARAAAWPQCGRRCGRRCARRGDTCKRTPCDATEARRAAERLEEAAESAAEATRARIQRTVTHASERKRQSFPLVGGPVGHVPASTRTQTSQHVLRAQQAAGFEPSHAPLRSRRSRWTRRTRTATGRATAARGPCLCLRWRRRRAMRHDSRRQRHRRRWRKHGLEYKRNRGLHRPLRPAKTQAPSGVRAEPARASEDQDEPAVKMPPRRATRRTRVPDDQNDDADDEARDGAANMRSLFADAEAAAAEQAPAAPAWATRRRRTRA